MDLNEAIRFQESMSKRVIEYDVIERDKLAYICGIDVSYRDNIAFPCAVILDRENNVVAQMHKRVEVDTPYISGLLFLREGKVTLDLLECIKRVHSYDLIMVDGNGLLHPRHFGLACYIGIMTDKPTIGVAKSLLCGEIKDGYVIHNGRVVGILFEGKRRLYVSVGHKVSLETAFMIVKAVTRYSIPEPIRLADICSKKSKASDIA